MSFAEAAILVAIVLGIGVLAWVITARVTNLPQGPTEEQRRMVANNFMRGAQLMGRCGKSKEDAEARRTPHSQSADGRPKSAESTSGRSPLKGPSREDLREAIRCFDEALRAYPNDFSTRFLKAQALEELGELNEALKELDWLLSQKASVKPNFVRRMAMAVGVMESRSVAPLGTKLLGKCEVDLVVFHIRKRKGRVLLKKRRVADAVHEIALAKSILDKLAWDEELQKREERVNVRMKSMGQERSVGKEKESKQGSLTPRGVSTPKKVGPGNEEEAELLLDRGIAASGDSTSYAMDAVPGKSTKEPVFKIPYARAELDLMLARCYEEQGNAAAAAQCLEEASRIGNVKTQEEARLAIVRLEESMKNGDKFE